MITFLICGGAAAFGFWMSHEAAKSGEASYSKLWKYLAWGNLVVAAVHIILSTIQSIIELIRPLNGVGL